MIYNVKKKEMEKILLSSLLKSFGAVILLHIINFIVFLLKSLPVESVRFSRGLFYINGESISISLLATLKMFLILLVLFSAYGIYKTNKENRNNKVSDSE